MEKLKMLEKNRNCINYVHVATCKLDKKKYINNDNQTSYVFIIN